MPVRRGVSDGGDARASLSVVLACGAAMLGVALVACGAFAVSDSPDGSSDGGPDALVGTDADPLVTDGAAGDAPSAQPTTLASGYDGLSGIAATATTVYFLEQTSGNLNSVPLDGSAKARLVFATNASPHTLAIVGDAIYWADTGKTKLSYGSLTGTFTAMNVSPPAGTRPVSLAASPAGVVALLLTGDPMDGHVVQYDLALNETGVAVTGQQNPFQVAMLGDQIFWTESAGRRVAHGTFGTTTNNVLSNVEVDAESITADAKGVYWSAGSDVRMASSAGSLSDVSTTEDVPASLATDDTSVYWLTKTAVRRWNRVAGAAPTTIATGSFEFGGTQFRGLVVTASYLVWMTADGKVMRLTKSW